MNKIFLLMVIIFFGLLSCTDDNGNYMDEGTITGIDFRECSCCGGYFIAIKDSTYRFKSLPAGSNIIADNPKFPIYVKLDWTMDDTLCLGDEIKVFRITFR